MNLVFSDLRIPKKIKITLLIQITMSNFVPIVACGLIGFLTDPIEILKEFVGLVVLVEIDNWIGSVFELYIDTYHNEIPK